MARSLDFARGAATPDGTTYFEYTDANLPKKVAIEGGSTVEFRYDGALQRTAMVADGTATYYVWDGLRLLETRDADYSPDARLTHGVAPIEGIGSCVAVFVQGGDPPTATPSCRQAASRSG